MADAPGLILSKVGKIIFEKRTSSPNILLPCKLLIKIKKKSLFFKSTFCLLVNMCAKVCLTLSVCARAQVREQGTCVEIRAQGGSQYLQVLTSDHQTFTF